MGVRLQRARRKPGASFVELGVNTNAEILRPPCWPCEAPWFSVD